LRFFFTLSGPHMAHKGIFTLSLALCPANPKVGLEFCVVILQHEGYGP
jgi:hypothetical protein